MGYTKKKRREKKGNSYPGLDITYAQSRDAQLINWRLFLEKSDKTALEWVAAKDLSRRWQTTAVADVSVYLPRYAIRCGFSKGSPKCEELRVLSRSFTAAIFLQDVKKALDLYNYILRVGLQKTMKFIQR